MQTACLACVSVVGASSILRHAVRSKCGAGAGRSQDSVFVCSSALGSCVNHPAWLSSDHPWGVLSLTDGVTVEPRKPTIHKTGRIWTAYLTSAIFNDSWVMPDDLGLQMEYMH